MIIKSLFFVFLITLSLWANADFSAHKKYQNDLQRCTREVETRLLESPEFSGRIWEASGRANVVCGNRLGNAPKKFSRYEQQFADYVNKASPKRWSEESIIDVVSSLAKKHQSSFLGVGNSYGKKSKLNISLDY